MPTPLCSVAACPLSCDQAVSILWEELRRRGLAETYRVAALHGSPDVTAEGAAFAAILLPRQRVACPRGAGCEGLKLLIEQDGAVSCRAWKGRGSRHQLAETCCNIVAGEREINTKKCLDAVPVSEHADDLLHRDLSAANTSLIVANARMNRDAIVHE